MLSRDFGRLTGGLLLAGWGDVAGFEKGASKGLVVGVVVGVGVALAVTLVVPPCPMWNDSVAPGGWKLSRPRCCVWCLGARASLAVTPPCALALGTRGDGLPWPPV